VKPNFLIILLTIIISYPLNARYISNSFTFTKKDPPLIYISDLSLDDVNKLFAEFLNDKNISFGYPVTGC